VATTPGDGCRVLVPRVLTWESSCVMHRAEGGSFAGKYRRDLRRTTVHDDSPYAWGLNKAGKDERPGFVLYNL
jgi:alpha-ketoglutarate-dependent 2,4-dichlorophenoxyacetate dioxygenase